MKRLLLYRVVPLSALAVLALAGAALTPHSASSRPPVANDVLRHALDVQLGRAQARPGEMPISTGLLYALLDQTGALSRRAAQAGYRPAHVEVAGSEGCQNEFTGNGQTNTRVVQDCSLRAQAGEALAVNPADENNILVSQNDSRVGFNHCGFDWTLDGASHWGDQTPPFFQFQLLDGHTADACADPSITWDSEGNAYIAGEVFDVVDPENGIVVAKSNAGIHGTYFHSPDSSKGFQEYQTVPLGVVANDDEPGITNDKPSIVADASPSSPKRDNVYVAWTRFQPEEEAGTRIVSPIFFSQSTDGGKSWSDRIEISGENPDVCPGECFNDQGAQAFVGPDGTIYVVFSNIDGLEGPSPRILFVKCPGNEDCTIEESWTEPEIVAPLVGGEPTGPSPKGCPSSAGCLPPNGYLVNEMTSLSTSVDAAGNVYVAWADFRNNTNPNCTGPASSASAPCDNDVFYVVSTDGGEHWSDPRNVTPRSNSRFGETAQWQPWSEVAGDGSRLWVGFYDRAYGDCEATGCNDITAAEIIAPASESPTYSYSRVTTGSMPNLTTADNPLEAGFLGERMALDVDSQGRAHLAWADTRQHAGAAPEEDVYYARVPAPVGPPPPPPPPPPAPPPPPPPPPAPPPPVPPPPPPPPPPVRCVVPRVIGLKLGRARTRIRARHCSVGSIRRTRSRRVGRVLAQRPRAGAVRRRGYPVRLVVGRR